MDNLRELELYDACTGLGQWYERPLEDGTKKKSYFVNKDRCLECVKDIVIALREPSPELRMHAHMKVGEWKVMTEHLIPIFEHYRKDEKLCAAILEAMAHMTSRIRGSYEMQMRHLEYLQDYKENMAKKDIMIVLMRMLIENMEDEAAEEQIVGESSPAANFRKSVFESLVALIRHLISTPDPLPGDRGFTPTRRDLQVRYISYFHYEGFLEFVVLWAEEVLPLENLDQAWAILDIVYHVCIKLSPEDLCRDQVERDKKSLGLLLEKDQTISKLRTVQSSRHSRFGTIMQNKSILGGSTISASVYQTSSLTKGGSVWRREFHDPTDRSDKKRNVFHDPFFMDLEEGSARDHNLLNPLLRNSLEGSRDFSRMTKGLKKFFDDFIQSAFSSLVSLLRRTCTTSALQAAEGHVMREYERPKVLSFCAWVLEFYRHSCADLVAKAKSSGGRDTAPGFDVSIIQGAIDLDMIQFVTARVREYGKDSNIHSSHLVIVLRTLVQQLKVLTVCSESQDPETRDCGRILLQNIVKDDIMAHLVWIMQNFKSTSHDPRIMSYVVEAFHHLTRLMAKVLEDGGGPSIEFQVEKARGSRTSRSTTTGEKEIAALADARVVENLFYMLEKYKRHSVQLHSMLVKLIYQIIKAKPTNIVVFFELSYFTRIHRVVSDPLFQDRKESKRYQEMLELLRYILRQFFKCAEKNGCVFAELLFRKVQENSKVLLESHGAEFAAILDNYENDEYRLILDRVAQGEMLRAPRGKKAEAEQPWTAEEDNLLRSRHAVYAEHPLVAELLAAELPEDSNRNARQVRKRLQELGLAQGGRNLPSGAAADDGDRLGDPGLDEAEEVGGAPAAKRQKVDDKNTYRPMEVDGAAAAGVTQVETESLQEEMERLLDAALDAHEEVSIPAAAATPTATAADNSIGGASIPPAAAGTVADTAAATAAAFNAAAAVAAAGTALESQLSSQGLDVERELEAMLDADDASVIAPLSRVGRPPEAPRPPAPAEDSPPTATAMQTATAMGTMPPPPQPPASAPPSVTAPAAAVVGGQDDHRKATRAPRVGEGRCAAAGSPGNDVLQGTAEEEEDARGFWEAVAEAAPAAGAATGASQQFAGAQSQSLELDLENIMEDTPPRGAAASQSSTTDGLSQALERIMAGASLASVGDGTGPRAARDAGADSQIGGPVPSPTPPAAATCAATPASEDLSQPLELELERIMDCATPIRRSGIAGLEGGSTGVAASQASAGGLSQSLEEELERIMECGTPLRGGVSAGTPGSDVKAAGADGLSQSLEMELENVMNAEET